MRGYVDNGGKSQFSWQFTAKLCINEAARFDACNTETSLTKNDRLRIEMAMIYYTRQGRTPASETNVERAASFVEARP